MTYLASDEAFLCDVGVTGDTEMVNGVLCERVVNRTGTAWIAWDDVERSGMFSYIPETEARELKLI